MEHIFLKDSHLQTCYFRANEAMELEPKQMESLYFCSRIALIIVLLLVHWQPVDDKVSIPKKAHFGAI